MGTVVVRNSVAKRVIVTLMPAISFLCMFGLAAISVNFLEYGSTADRIVGYILYHSDDSFNTVYF